MPTPLNSEELLQVPWRLFIYFSHKYGKGLLGKNGQIYCKEPEGLTYIVRTLYQLHHFNSWPMERWSRPALLYSEKTQNLSADDGNRWASVELRVGTPETADQLLLDGKNSPFKRIVLFRTARVLREGSEDYWILGSSCKFGEDDSFDFIQDNAYWRVVEEMGDFFAQATAHFPRSIPL